MVVTTALAPACQMETYRDACAARAAWGCFMMGNIYRDGAPGTPRDIGLANAAYARACDISPTSDACRAPVSD